jgi:hypothetical protein
MKLSHSLSRLRHLQLRRACNFTLSLALGLRKPVEPSFSQDSWQRVRKLDLRSRYSATVRLSMHFKLNTAGPQFRPQENV